MRQNEISDPRKARVGGDPGGNRTRDNLIKRRFVLERDLYDKSVRCVLSHVSLNDIDAPRKPLVYLVAPIFYETVFCRYCRPFIAVGLLLLSPLLLLAACAKPDSKWLSYCAHDDAKCESR